jgi:CheY-specific phosphatase CheX
MKIETLKYVNFFNIAINKVFNELFNMPIQKKGSYMLNGNGGLKDITSFMTVGGDITGLTLISSPEDLLALLYFKLMNEEFKNNDKSKLEDVCKEILNIAVGQAKNLIAINYNKIIKLQPPKILKENINKPIVASEIIVDKMHSFIFGAYLVEKE